MTPNTRTTHTLYYPCLHIYPIFAIVSAAAYVSPDGSLPPNLMSSVIAQGHKNVTWLPDPISLHPLPWAGGDDSRMAQVFGVPYQLTDGLLQPIAIASRAAALKQLKRLDDRGWIIKAGTEIEFNLLDAENDPVASAPDYCGQLTFAKVEDVLLYFQKNLVGAGVHIETMHAEVSAGEFEFTLRPELGIKAVDNIIICRHAMKEMAAKRGLNVSFLGKRNPTELGTALNFNFSLWESKAMKNIFLDEHQSDKLSKICHHWIAGLCCHADALVALCLLTINCYRFLHRCYTPHRADWGIDNRDACFRVKNAGEGGSYIELRLSTSLTNPYLVMAAILAAGLDGVEKELECPDPMSADAKVLPTTMQEALAALEADVMMKAALGEGLIDGFVKFKKEIDLTKFQHHDVSVDDEAQLLAEMKMYDQLV